MAEVWFYHLEKRSADAELPGLLQRGLSRGLRMAVVAQSPERLRDLSQKIWAFEETAFIPHGTADEPQAHAQPVFLCCDDAPPNAADYRFYLDGTAPAKLDGLTRASIMFDGQNPEAVDLARQQWRALKPLASAIRYWKQDEAGSWKDQSA
jgi:DNA polymerase III subunit chi